MQNVQKPPFNNNADISSEAIFICIGLEFWSESSPISTFCACKYRKLWSEPSLLDNVIRTKKAKQMTKSNHEV